MPQTQCKKLIEVAMPVKEISAESVRDKSIRHGHISTLHLWWARRPLPVCRAVVFASLIPDPLDAKCPQSFKDAIEKLLGAKNNPGDPYKPYTDIPYTVSTDKMDDNLRNRLLMFIGKFSDTFIHNEKQGKTTPAKDKLNGFSLIKWDNKNNETIINKARKLIWVAHDPDNNTLKNFDQYYNALKQAENELYSTKDRHIDTDEVKSKEQALHESLESFLNRMPKVFDPFAGGGAIPLEAARLGCRTYANDLNPVAHIIQKGSVEFPQKYGKPITFSKDEFIKLYDEKAFQEQQQQGNVYGAEVKITNRLAFDVEYYAKKLLQMTEEEIGHYYPADENGNKPIAYYWVYRATCSNPSCKAKVPLLKQFYLCNKPNKKIYLQSEIVGKKINFDIKEGECNQEAWLIKRKLKCPICGNVTDDKELKRQFNNYETTQHLIVVIDELNNSKYYRLPNKEELEIFENIPTIESPQEMITQNDSKNLWLTLWGLNRWGQLFSKRQLLTIMTILKNLNKIKSDFLNEEESKYSTVIITFLAILTNRSILDSTKLGRWRSKTEINEHLFARQAIPMLFDFPEVNIFKKGSNYLLNRLEYILKVISSEALSPFSSICNNASSGEINQFNLKSINAVITDPPYYDAIAYADLSDFFYIWLKRSLSDSYPFIFAFPLTPKSDECTALKHHHNNNMKEAKLHFEMKLLQILNSIEKQTSGIISIMFAHQSTEAWTTLCNSILGGNMNITGSWSIDTEMASRTMALAGLTLTSSITVSCLPSEKSGFGNFKTIKKSIDMTVKEEINFLYKLGFRGADLLTACFGKAVSVFGQYEKVEKADGTEVTVAELLEMAREAAFNAIISDIDTDDATKFYIGWLNLFGFVQAEHDDVRRVTQIGLNIDVDELLANNILLRTGNKENLAALNDRVQNNAKLGDKGNSFMIDKVHKAMDLFRGNNRHALVKYIAQHANTDAGPLWRVLNSLFEILPAGSEDYKQASGLITNKDSLIREAKQQQQTTSEQMDLI